MSAPSRRIALAAAALAAAACGEAAFEGRVVDADGPPRPWFKVAADLDGDGRGELVVGGQRGPLVAYAHTDAGFRRHPVATGGFDGVGAAAGDLDGDGDADLVLGGLVWLENPGGLEEEWTHHGIDDFPAHDVALADLDGDGRLDVVARDQEAAGDAIRLYLRPGGGFVRRDLAVPAGEGLAVGDLDADGDPDLVFGEGWLANPGAPLAGAWARHAHAPGWAYARSKVALADLDGDGRLDVVLAPAEPRGGRHRIAWARAPEDPAREAFEERVLVRDTETVVHALVAEDFDLDGHVDVAFAEMHQGEDPDRVVVLWNEGCGARFRPERLSDAGSHNLQAVDADGDGDGDLFGANWAGPRTEVTWWENRVGDRLDPRLGRWRRRLVDGALPWRAVLVAAADVDGDGRTDLLAGGAWYRNPGRLDGVWRPRAVGAPFANVAWAGDLDGDGDTDLLGTDGRPRGARLVAARNQGMGRFAVRVVAEGAGDFLQGLARLPGDGFALSWHAPGRGVELLRPPAGGPWDGAWRTETLHPDSQDEALSAADLDGDGDLDLFQGTRWLRREADGTWTSFVAADLPWRPDRHALADVNGDGRLDAVVGFEGARRDLVWLEAPEAPTRPWPVHRVARDLAGGYSLGVADFDGDGDPEVVLGEHRAEDGRNRVLLFENTAAGGRFREHLVDGGACGGIDHHLGTLPVDLDGDGDLDLVSVGWAHPKLWIHENLGRAAATADR